MLSDRRTTSYEASRNKQQRKNIYLASPRPLQLSFHMRLFTSDKQPLMKLMERSIPHIPLLSLHSPLANPLEITTGMLATPAQREIRAFPAVKRDRGHVTRTLDGLANGIEAMVYLLITDFSNDRRMECVTHRLQREG